MAEPRVVEIPGVGNVEFPDSMSEADVNTASAKLYGDAKAGKSVVESKPKGFIGQLKDRVTSDAKDVANAPGAVGKATTALNKVSDAYSDSEIGAYKGLGGTAYSLTNLANKGLRFLASHAPGATPEQVDKVIPAMNPELPSFLKPSNPIQSIGKGAEQTAEFFVPGGVVSKGSKAIEAASVASKLPKLFQTGLRVGGQAALEGTANAAVAKAQGGEVAPAFLMGAGGKVAGEAASALPSFLKNFASKQYEKVLAPTTKDNKFLTNRVLPGLVDKAPIAATRNSFIEKAGTAAAEKGQQIGEAVNALPDSATASTKPVLDRLEQYKNNFKVDGKVVDPQAVSAVEDLQGVIHQFGDDVSYKSLNKVRQIFDKSVAQAKGFAGKTLAEGSAIDAKREASNAIREELAKNQPDIAKINAEFNFWKNVEKVAKDTAQRKTGQAPGLGDTAASVGGAVVGGTKAGLGGLLGYATGIAVLRKALKSTGTRTVTAAMASRIADGLVSGNPQAVITALGRVSASVASRKPTK
jgi:hypothetical protein